MEVLNPAHPRKFLKFCGPPYEECLCEMTLKTGFQFVAWIDIILGLMNLIAALLALPFAAIGIIRSLIMISGIALGISALIGLIGIRKLKMDKIFQYSYGKQIYLFAMSAILVGDILLELIEVNASYSYSKSIIFSLLYNVLTAKLIWSTLVRLENNESLLVFYGKRTLLMMMQQGGTLSNMPGVIVQEGHVYGTPIEADN